MITCKVIEDLLPLYADKICSDDSRVIVEHHVAECTECREKLEAMTVKLESDGAEKIELEHSKIFNGLRKRYLRLIAATLLICAAILIPAAICGVLYLNDQTNLGVSFSTLKADSELRSLGKMFKNGDYAEVLENIILPNQDTYPKEKLAEFKRFFAGDFKNYFNEHPITKINIFSQQELNGTVTARLYLELEKQAGFDETPVYRMEFKYTANGMELEHTYLDFGGEFDKSDGVYYNTAELSQEEYQEIYLSFKPDLPALRLVDSNFSEQYFGSLEREKLDELKTISMFSLTKFPSLYLTDKITLEREKTKEFAEKYYYLECKTGETEYVTDELYSRLGRFYIQHAELRFLYNGEIISVKLDVPYSMETYPNRVTAVRNITYSDNCTAPFCTDSTKTPPMV